MSAVNVTQKSYRDREWKKASKMEKVDVTLHLQPSADGTQSEEKIKRKSDERLKFVSEVQKKTEQKEEGTQMEMAVGDASNGYIARGKPVDTTQKGSGKTKMVSIVQNPPKGASKIKPKPRLQSQLVRPPFKSVGSVNQLVSMDQGDDDEDGDDDSYSEDIMVLQTEENEAYLNRVIIGKLSLLGLRRTLWTSKFESFFVIFCFLLTYDSLSSFAIEYDKYGPVFIFYYLLFVIVLAIPTMFMEMSLGQYTSSTVGVVFDRMVPALMGIGLTCLAYNFLTTISDQMIMPLFVNLFFYSVKVLEGQLAYHHCSNGFNDIECRSLMNPTCEELNQQLEARSEVDPMYREDSGLRYVAYGDLCVQSRLTPVYMDENEPLDLEDPFGVWMGAISHNQFTQWNFDFNTGRYLYLPEPNEMFVHCFSWFVVFYICQQSQKYIVKVQKVTMFLIMSILLTLLVAVLYFNPPAHPLFDSFTSERTVDHFQAMISAAILVARVFKLGQGGFVYFGAQNHIHNRILPDCFVIAIVMTVFPMLYSILHLLICDSFFLGVFNGDKDNFEVSRNGSFEEPVYTSANQIIQFTVFAMSLSSLGPYESFITSILTFGLMLLVMVNKIIAVEIIASSIVEFFFEQEDHSRILTVVVFAGALGTFMFQGGLGFEILVGTDTLLLPLLGILILLSELIALNIYGRKRFFANLMFICNRRNLKDPWRWLKQWIVFVIGFLLLVGIPLSSILQIIGLIVDYQNVPNSMSGFVIVIFIFVGGVIPAIAYIRVNDRLSKSGDLHGTFSPNRDLWGPRSRADRNVAEMVERELVKTSTFHRKMGQRKKRNEKTYDQ